MMTGSQCQDETCISSKDPTAVEKLQDFGKNIGDQILSFFHRDDGKLDAKLDSLLPEDATVVSKLQSLQCQRLTCPLVTILLSLSLLLPRFLQMAILPKIK
jgi:hypothetical protein